MSSRCASPILPPSQRSISPALLRAHNRVPVENHNANLLPASDEEGRQILHVRTTFDDQKFKLLMKGSVGSLKISKIKRYLHKFSSIPPSDQILYFNGQVIDSDRFASEYGIENGSTCILSRSVMDGEVLDQNLFTQSSEFEPSASVESVLPVEENTEEMVQNGDSSAQSDDVFEVEDSHTTTDSAVRPSSPTGISIISGETGMSTLAYSISSGPVSQSYTTPVRVRPPSTSKSSRLISSPSRSRSSILSAALSSPTSPPDSLLESDTNVLPPSEETVFPRPVLPTEKQSTSTNGNANHSALSLPSVSTSSTTSSSPSHIPTSKRVTSEVESKFSSAPSSSSVPLTSLSSSRSSVDTTRNRFSSSIHSVSVAPGSTFNLYERLTGSSSAYLVSQSSRSSPTNFKDSHSGVDLSVPSTTSGRSKYQDSDFPVQEGLRVSGLTSSKASSSIRSSSPSSTPFHEPSTVPTSRSLRSSSPQSTNASKSDGIRREVESSRDATSNTKGSSQVSPWYSMALANVNELSIELGEDRLAFDENHTCVIGIETPGSDAHHPSQINVLVTFDADTNRLHVYGTLLTSIPQSSSVRLRLYESLLDGALLGRDMCGGGIGLSVKNELVLLHTSIDMRTSTRHALKTIIPEFVNALKRWRARARDIVQHLDSH